MKIKLTSLVMMFVIAMPAFAQNDNTCRLKVSMPQSLFQGEKEIEMAITANTETGEEDLGILKLTPNNGGLLAGEWTITADKALAASAVWTVDPHAGFAFFIEPGVVTVDVKRGQESFVATGTPLNDIYIRYKAERASANYRRGDSIAEDYMQKYNDTPLFGTIFTDHSAVLFGEKKDVVERLWAIGGENGKKMKYALDAYNRICHNDITNGEPLRDVEIPNATVEGIGETVRLSDYIGKGKWVFVDFWASWCGGCRQAIPTVKQAYQQLKDKNILFVSIAEWDRRAAALKAMKEEDMPWLQLIDEKGKCGDVYMFNTIPRFMLFAPDGTLADKDVDRMKIISVLTEKVNGVK